MRETRIMMGMPITVEIVGATDSRLHELAFDYFEQIDRRFSTYKPESEISAINAGQLPASLCSPQMHEVLSLAETTRWETEGYFDIRRPDGLLDPSGIVKGWAIRNAARLLKSARAVDFFIDAGGDIQPSGKNADAEEWRVGIRHPFDDQEIVKVLYPRGRGVATSGTYVRGQHIYDPHAPGQAINDIVSLTVIACDVLEADRFATAAFAMGAAGIGFIESVPGLEGYAINAAGIATMTSQFAAFTKA
jgi:thiamine biosynthesis lipoprotein